MESEEMLNVYPAQAGNRCMLLKKILSCLYLSDYTTRTLPDRRYYRVFDIPVLFQLLEYIKLFLSFF